MESGGHHGRIPRADVVLAIALFALAGIEIATSGYAPGTVLAAAAYTLPLALRRSLPVVAAIGVCAGALLGFYLGDEWPMMLALVAAMTVAAYSVAAYSPLKTAVIGGLLVLAGPEIAEAQLNPGETDLVAMGVIVAGTWAAGRFARRLRLEGHELATFADLLERQREAKANLAVVDERARLARELHDAVAHSVSAMVIQGAAAEAVLTRTPENARGSLHAVQTLGREAITEMRRMLRILRATAVPESRAEPTRRSVYLRPSRWRLRWSTRLDVLLAVACFTFAEWSVLAPDSLAADRLASALLVAAATLPLVARRRFPVAVLLTTVVAVALFQLQLEDPGAFPEAVGIPLLIALYSVGAHAEPRRALGATAIAVLAAAIVDYVTAGWGIASSVAYYSLMAGIFAVPGFAIRAHRQNAERMRTLTGRLQREGDALARLAVADERARVARELHDTIAHGVSVMVLQAGAAEQVMTSRPDQARQAVQAVQDTGRTVLEELSQLLGLLHTDEEDSPRAPQPSLAQLDTLVSRVREAGLPVSVRVAGDPVDLSPGVDASAYRVIQEALTNALKHTGRAPTEVHVNYEPSALALEVLSDGGRPRARRAREHGHGLVGMRERVELYGGKLHAGPEPSGGYAVRAHLPFEGGVE